ncbi:MAG: substrate-binding domain-containing protein [Hyphomicrobiales bacterium]
MNRVRFFLYAAAIALCAAPVVADDNAIIVQSTTSTQNSGLYDFLLPKIKEATGVTAHIVAVGTGQAIKNARNCDGDVLLVHAKKAEEDFVASGFGVKRHDLMFNQFVIIGPSDDPAQIVDAPSAKDALKKIAVAKAPFASRGDNSGTHKREEVLWNAARYDPEPFSGTWYRETGSGMGATLNIAVGMNAYTLSDEATWISFKNKRDFQILVSGDDALFNQYGIILVNQQKCPNANSGEAKKVVDWMLSADGQAAINAFRVDDKQLFTANAKLN